MNAAKDIIATAAVFTAFAGAVGGVIAASADVFTAVVMPAAAMLASYAPAPAL
ncbi:MAG: hypothetical protein VX640_09795 [Pseudomonadota bacterium]|nr:hypothetical protein [Pseudomonadota bacterium]